MAINILQPKVSKLSNTMEGQQILVYGSNSTGKSFQGSKLKDVLFLPFENGIRTLNGVEFFPVNSWKDFREINKALTDPKTIEEVKKKYKSIVFDEVYTAARYLTDYVCKLHGADSIREGNNGYGLWSELETEWFQQIDKLMKAGFLVYFVGHTEVDKTTNQIVPKGDKRTMQFIRDNADIVAYLKSNGVDDKGRVVPSSAYLAETPEFFARSRYTHIDPFIPEFSADNLAKAVNEAIKRQEEADGVKSISREEQVQLFESETQDFDSVLSEVNELGGKLANAGHLDELLKLVKKHLGEKKVAEAKPSDVDLVFLLLLDVRDLVVEKGI